MTDNEINRTIAEWMGWTDVQAVDGELRGYDPAERGAVGADQPKLRRLPDYPGDMGAVWEAHRKACEEWGHGDLRQYQNAIRDHATQRCINDSHEDFYGCGGVIRFMDILKYLQPADIARALAAEIKRGGE